MKKVKNEKKKKGFPPGVIRLESKPAIRVIPLSNPFFSSIIFYRNGDQIPREWNSGDTLECY